jgi:hypothetical protein
MTKRSRILQLVEEQRLAPSSSLLHIEIAPPRAKVMLLPGRFRGAEHVKHHVDYVLTLNAERGEQHVRRNLKALRRTLEEMGADDRDIDAELGRFEGAVRAEIWRRVLLPDDR